MVNLCNKNGCRGLNCHKSPRFNFPNVARGIFCDAHKLDGAHLQISVATITALLCCAMAGPWEVHVLQAAVRLQLSPHLAHGYLDKMLQPQAW